MRKVYGYEPWFFIFFGIFHLHRIWGLVDRVSYAAFWMNVMEGRGIFYFILMGILALLCILGILTFFRNLHHNYWWRWIYLCGSVYLLFDLFAIAAGLEFWHGLLRAMFDMKNPYWNLVWGGFVVLGGFAFALGCSLLKRRLRGRLSGMIDELAGKCGFYCGACPTYLAGNCKGCVEEHQEGDCFTRDCVIKQKLNFCGECRDFPCSTILTHPHTTVLDKDWLQWKKQSDTNR